MFKQEHIYLKSDFENRSGIMVICDCLSDEELVRPEERYILVVTGKWAARVSISQFNGILFVEELLLFHSSLAEYLEILEDLKEDDDERISLPYGDPKWQHDIHHMLIDLERGLIGIIDLSCKSESDVLDESFPMLGFCHTTLGGIISQFDFGEGFEDLRIDTYMKATEKEALIISINVNKGEKSSWFDNI